jgi:hypothetical protein
MKSRSGLALVMGIFVSAATISDFILFVIMSSATPRLYFKLETPYLYLQLFSLFLAPIFAIVAWRMANTDLKRTHAGLISPSARGTTKVAKFLGVFGTFFSPLIALLGLLLLFSSARIAAAGDAMMQHLIELGADAHRYRLRPVSHRGGAGSFAGYSVPGRLAQDEYGIYKAAAVYRDSVRFTAEATLGFPGTVSVTIDSTGKPQGAWTYTGDFQF